MDGCDWSSPAKETEGSGPVAARPALPPRLGRYRLVRELDRGSAAIVYLARDLVSGSAGRAVALKVYGDDRNLLARFGAEVLLSKRANHPNIVAVLDAGVADGRFYLAMKPFSGGSLARRLVNVPLPEAQVVELGIVLARALDQAHRERIVHRDVKPGNVLLDWRGRPHLTDFGLALDLRRGDGAGQSAGTPAFMAPEQVLRRGLDARVDIYGLGATLYECLTGSTPFECTTPQRLRQRILDEAPVPPGRRRRGISPALDRVVVRCLAKRPDERWATAGALADALEATLDEVRAEACAETPAEGIERPLVPLEAAPHPAPVAAPHPRDVPTRQRPRAAAPQR